MASIPRFQLTSSNRTANATSASTISSGSTSSSNGPRLGICSRDCQEPACKAPNCPPCRQIQNGVLKCWDSYRDPLKGTDVCMFDWHDCRTGTGNPISNMPAAASPMATSEGGSSREDGSTTGTAADQNLQLGTESAPSASPTSPPAGDALGASQGSASEDKGSFFSSPAGVILLGSLVGLVVAALLILAVFKLRKNRKRSLSALATPIGTPQQKEWTSSHNSISNPPYGQLQRQGTSAVNAVTNGSAYDASLYMGNGQQVSRAPSNQSVLLYHRTHSGAPSGSIVRYPTGETVAAEWQRKKSSSEAVSGDDEVDIDGENSAYSRETESFEI